MIHVILPFSAHTYSSLGSLHFGFLCDLCAKNRRSLAQPLHYCQESQSEPERENVDF